MANTGQQAGFSYVEMLLCVRLLVSQGLRNALGLQEHIPHLFPCLAAIQTHSHHWYRLPKTTAMSH